MTAPRPSPDPICVRVNDAARMIGVGRTKLYELIAAGAKPALCSEDIIEEFSNFLTNHIKLP